MQLKDVAFNQNVDVRERGGVGPSQLSAIAKNLYIDGTIVQRKLQHWRPFICPFERLVPYVRPGASVLDIGCGQGLLLGLMAGLGFNFEGVGVDVSRPAVAVAEKVARRVAEMKLNARLVFQQSEDESQWPMRTFDVVFLVDVLHHVPRSRQREFLDQAISRVKANGVLVYKDMCSKPSWRAYANQIHDLLLSRQWIAHVPISQIEAWAQSRGLQVFVQEDIARFWYGHELRVMARPDAKKAEEDECRAD